jgi:hypothetical protein
MMLQGEPDDALRELDEPSEVTGVSAKENPMKHRGDRVPLQG